MRILALADEEEPALWDHYVPGRLDGIDLIVSCGDLKASYLSFLVTMGRARLFYVHGNHDEAYLSSPPEGCEDIDGQLIEFNGLRILGLGGCVKYREGAYQFTEAQMRRRIRKLRLALHRSGGVDMVICHAPPAGLGDLPDAAHQGFLALRELLERYRPRILLHGHVHLRYNRDVPRELQYADTRIINASGRYVFDIPELPAVTAGTDRIRRFTRRREPDDGWDAFRPR